MSFSISVYATYSMSFWFNILCYLNKLSMARCAALGGLVGLLLVGSGCQSWAQTNNDDRIAPALAGGEEEQIGDVPQQELSAGLLYELLVLNLALYDDQWRLGLAHAKAAAISSRDPRLAKAASVLAVQNKDFKSALEIAEFWLQLQPETEDGLDILIISQVNQGQVEQALRSLSSKDALSNSNIDKTIRKVAGLVVQQDNSTSALALIEQILALHPDSAQVNLSSAYVAAAFKDKSLASARLDRALELKPGWESAALSKVELIDEAAQSQTRISYLQDYLSEYPDSLAMRTLYVAELARARKLDSALQEVKKVLKSDARNIQALTYAAIISAQQDDIKNAQKYYRRVLDVEPRNEDALLALARTAEGESKYVTAAKYYNQVASEKNYLYAQMRLAVIAAAQQNVEEALELFGLLEPSNEQEYLEIAMTRHYVLLQAQRLEEAMGFINDSLIYLPDDLRLLYARGLVAAEMNDVKLAEADFSKVLEVDPTHVDALNALGYTLADQTKRYKEAEKLIVQAMTLQPDSAHIMDSYGWVMFRQGEFEVAREYLSRALEMSDEVEIAIHLGEVLWAMGEQDKARELWLKVQAQQPDSQALLSTVTRLGVILDER
jgi:tetratricopeptide (TPR) repeat protein